MRDPRALADPERSNIELDGEDAVQRPPSVPSQAAEAGYSEGALYWHFASREEVLLALLEERVDAPMREMVALLESAPPDRDMSVEAAREFARQLRDQREAVVGVRLSMRASVWTPCLIRSQDRRGPGIR